MYFKKKFLIVFVSTFLFTTLAFAESNVQFGGYARAGFGLNLSQFNKNHSDLGYRPLSSRHIRELNYLQLDLTKNFDNNSKLAISVDSETFQNTHLNNDWNLPVFRVRNAYYNIPVDETFSVWAGVRYFLFSDIRLLDYLLDYNAIGAGVTISKNTDVFVSVDQKRGGKVNGPEDVTIVAHSTFELNSNLNISPEVRLTRYSSGTQQGEEGATELTSGTGFLARVLAGFHNESMWNNVFVAYERQPQDYTSKETKNTFTVGDSGSFNFADSFGLLVGALFNYEKYSNALQVYDKGTAKEGKTEKSRVTASVDLQPVYYMTDRIQLALDLNKTIITEYFGATEIPSALYITPICRYSFNKDTIANAQIYTSVTYSNFDWKWANDGKKATDNLLTMQTGFEIAF